MHLSFFRLTNHLAFMVGVLLLSLVCGAEEQTPLPIEAPAETPLQVSEFKALVDIVKSVEPLSKDLFRLKFHAVGLINTSDPRVMDGDLSRVDGQWKAGTARTPNYNQALHQLQVVEGSADDNRIKLKIKATLKPDRWVPKDGKEQTLVFELDLKPTDQTPQGNNDPSTAGQFWKVFPKSVMPTRGVTGTWKVVDSPFDGDKKEGKVTGSLSVPIAPNRWNMGELNDDKSALELSFDMGKSRGNWNHARLTQLGFDPARNMTGWDGLRVSIDTTKPRGDVSVAIWLREADGSWYYIKSAVPLVAKSNQAVVLWEDFSEAEWVSPTNHMDEDYQLDIRNVTHIGVGVVNSLGVGEIPFAIKGVDLVKVKKPEQTPARARVTGKLLSVNGHDMVMPGIFGGYAPDLPEEFRPGSQRYLYAGHYPRIPDQHHVRFGANDIVDPAALAKALNQTDDPRIKKFVAAFEGKKDERSLKTLQSAPPGGNKAERHARAVANSLNSKLKQRDWLWDKQLWDASKLPASSKALLAKLEDGSITDTEMMRLNRDLLSVLTNGAVKPSPAGGAVEKFYVDCLGERKQAAFMLHNPNWRQWFDEFGRAFARNAEKNNYVAHFEFWNEPYLNWAERSRVNYDLKYYNVAEAGVDKPVQIKYGDGSLGPVVPHFAWRKDDKGNWQVYDTSAFTFWSGKGNGWLYDQMFGVVAKAIKETNPKVQVIAGWGFRWHEDHWAAWDMLYKPTIDRNIEYIDAIHEHHYQGDTTAMNGSYEVLTAYGMTAHNKWLYSYNTETNDLVDAPARGAIAEPEAARNAKNYRRMTYNLRDMLYCVYQSPDKAKARAMIHWDHTREGSTICFDLLKNLRGRLIETQSPDRDVWVVASIDGTDPDALPPGFEMGKSGQTYTVMVFNNHREAREVNLEIDALTGTEMGDPLIETVVVDDAFQLTHKKHQETNGTTYAQDKHHITIPGRGVWKVSYSLSGRVKAEAESQVLREQYFSKDILEDVRPGKPLKTQVVIPKPAQEGASRAWLRLVVEDVDRGEGVVTISGKRYLIPHAIVGDNNNRIVQIPITLEGLNDKVYLEFSVGEGNYAGYRIDMASIVIEKRK